MRGGGFIYNVYDFSISRRATNEYDAPRFLGTLQLSYHAENSTRCIHQVVHGLVQIGSKPSCVLVTGFANAYL